MVDDKTGEGAKLPEDARLDSLEQRVRDAQAREAERTGDTGKSEDDSERQGSRVLSLLLGGVFGGTLLGWLFDRWLGTEPIWLISGLIFGTVGAFYSIMKMAAPRK
jgi:ATP synthase protein I